MSIKLGKKSKQTFKTVSGVKLLEDDYRMLEAYQASYQEAYGESIEIGELVASLSVAFMNGDSNFKKNFKG
jgi:hypothetical protein